MKRFPLPLTLMMSLWCLGLVLTATAQTPLLEVDYNGATVFHVLSDGRLLLPAGAAAGYVLTATDDGFASWQAVSASGGAINSDATLSGDGTAGNPLGVSVPLALTGGTGSNGTVSGAHSQGHLGLLGSDLFGALGLHSGGNIGTLGSGDYGVYGFSSTDAGVYGGHNNGTFGYLGGSTIGTYGEHQNGHYGWLGSSVSGVFGRSANGTFGWLGSGTGAYGEHSNGNRGALGTSTLGAYGEHTSGNWGYLGSSAYGVYGSGDPYAGYFSGDVHITGTLSGGSAASKVDHPLDPAGQYLSHSFVESPDMKNVYDGTVVLDAQGEAVVALPEYFEVLNRDFRYQLTAIGAPGPNVYVAEKISGNRFTIAGGTPGLEVSWQVTGIRHDPWAEEHRIIVEQDKPADEQGFYLHPGLYGQPETQRVGRLNEDQVSPEHEAMQQHRDEEHRQIEEQRRRMQAEHERFKTERASHSPRSDNQP